MKVLFACSRNHWRSPTAERIFRGRPGLEVRSRGLARTARRRLREADVAWAELIMVMEDEHLDRLVERFSAALGATPIHVLDIPDEHRFMDPALVAALEVAVAPILERAAASP